MILTQQKKTLFKVPPGKTLKEIIEYQNYHNMQSPQHYYQQMIISESIRFEIAKNPKLKGYSFFADVEMLLYHGQEDNPKVSPDAVVFPEIWLPPIDEEHSFCFADHNFKPVLVFEIGASQENERDYGEKVEIYQRLSIPEYIIIDLIKRKIQRYILEGGVYQQSSYNSNEHCFIRSLDLSVGFIGNYARFFDLNGNVIPLTDDLARQILEKDLIIDQMDGELKQKDGELKQSKAQIIQKDGELKHTKTNLNNKDGELKQTKTKLTKKDEELKQTKTKLTKKDEELKQTKTKLTNKDGELKQTKSKLIQKDGHLTKKDGELKQTKTKLKQKDGELKQTKTKLKQKDGELKQSKAQIIQKDGELKLKEIQLEKTSGQLKEQESIIENLKQLLNNQGITLK